MDERLQKVVDTVLERKEEEKKPRTVKEVEKKKTFLDQALDLLFSENPFDAIWELTKEQLGNFIRDFFDATVIGGLERSIKRDRKSRDIYHKSDRVRSLDNPSWDRSERKEPKSSRFENPGDIVDEVILEDRRQAELLISILEEDYLARYGQITVNNLNDTLGRTGKSFNSSYYGWRNLEGVRIRHTADGYWTVEFPRPVDLK